MMIGNSFLAINRAKWGYPGFFSYFSNQGTPKEDLGDFVLACLARYTQTPFQQIPSVVSAISLSPPIFDFNMNKKDCNDLIT